MSPKSNANEGIRPLYNLNALDPGRLTFTLDILILSKK